MTEAIDQIITLLAANWNTGTYDPRGYTAIANFFHKIIDAPFIKDAQVANNDYFFLYDILEPHNFRTLSQMVDDVEASVSIDIRTNSLANLNTIKDEAIRIFRENIVSVGGGWDRLTFTGIVDKSNKNVKLYRKIFQVTLFKSVLTT